VYRSGRLGRVELSGKMVSFQGLRDEGEGEREEADMTVVGAVLQIMGERRRNRNSLTKA
jgi:hypothetical protein